MQVVVKVVVDVNVDDYRAEYGENFTLDEIRGYVKTDVLESIDWNFVQKFAHFKSVETE